MLRKIFTLFMLCILFTGCTAKEEQEQANVTLKVLAWNETVFNRQYGNFFLATHPNYTLEVISIIENMEPMTDITKTIEELLVKENPDVISIPMESYVVLKDEGKLSSLTKPLQGANFDLTGFSPAIIDFLRDEQGELYGLTPVFTGQALYYNKSLFDQYGIAYPHDFMTWEEMFKLAEQFPAVNENHEPQYRLYHRDSSNPFMMALKVGESSGLSFNNSEHITLNTESWKQIFENVTDCFKTKACYDPNQAPSGDSMKMKDIKEMEPIWYPFLRGNIAMALDESTLYRTLMSKSGEPGAKPLAWEWGMATLPVSADTPHMGNGVYMNDIFAIPLGVKETEGALEFIQYICGESYAKLLPQINMTDLPTRPNLEVMDEPLKSFYKLEQVNVTLINQLRKFPASFLPKIDEISQKHMEKIMSDQSTVR
ncbi:ABC transporter substrate-binding protein [Paenibacillus macerans]|nr:ABC transporter substrate-binding protein [Paenibacillus macerans]